MSLPRPLRTKFGLSLREIAHFTSESLSAIKRQSIKDPQGLRAKVDAILGSQSQPECEEVDLYAEYEDVLAERNRLMSDLIAVHFACVSLGWNDAALRAQLKPIFDITRPHIEEPEA